MPLIHRIKITAADHGCYATSGAVAVKAAFNPVRAAALALIADGRDPADRLRGEWEGCSISPVTLATLARPYSPPRVNHKRSDPSRND
jgi:hypothetical protein